MAHNRRNLGKAERPLGQPGGQWAHFRRTCGMFAQNRHMDARPEELRELEVAMRQEPFAELLAEFEVQSTVQRRLATEYAAALDSCKRLQDDINHRSEDEFEPCPELDGRLEREVLELAVCEEAYELVSEELDLVRSELNRRGLSPH